MFFSFESLARIQTGTLGGALLYREIWCPSHVGPIKNVFIFKENISYFLKNGMGKCGTDPDLPFQVCVTDAE